MGLVINIVDLINLTRFIYLPDQLYLLYAEENAVFCLEVQIPRQKDIKKISSRNPQHIILPEELSLAIYSFILTAPIAGNEHSV